MPGGRPLRFSFVFLAAAVPAAPASAHAQAPSDCNAPTADAIEHVKVQGSPFTAVPSSDGCWIFVTVANPGGRGNVTALRRSGGVISAERSIPVNGNPTGLALTHDGTLLIVASGPMVAFIDVARLESGRGNPVLGYIDRKQPVGFIYASVTPDDRFVFLALERDYAIGVVDLTKIRAGKIDTKAIVGSVPTGNAPVGIAFSPDGRFAFTTAQAALPAWKWPVACKPEAQPGAAPSHAQGAVVVIDVDKAVRDPRHAVVSRVPAGCNPVRLALSPTGDRAYVTARGENALMVFDASKLSSDTAHARLARVTVGTSPVGVTVFDSGRRVVLTNSNRFGGVGGGDRQSLTVVDAAQVAAGATSLVGEIPAGAFPRELRMTADGRTLIATNFNSGTVEFIDLARIALAGSSR